MEDLCWIKSSGISMELCILKTFDEILSVLETFVNSAMITIANIKFHYARSYGFINNSILTYVF